MKKGHENKIRDEEPKRHGLLDSKTYFLAKQWLMKAYLNPWRALNHGRKRKS